VLKFVVEGPSLSFAYAQELKYPAHKKGREVNRTLAWMKGLFLVDHSGPCHFRLDRDSLLNTQRVQSLIQGIAIQLVSCLRKTLA
jgi:hypothetical protein